MLLQKTFRTDVISKKVIKNVGQMAQYYMPDHHEGIVSREQYNAVKAEMARRSALRSPSKAAVTGRSCYTSKYALSDRLVCGECGTLYRRCTWTSLGRKYSVWRCTSRLNYGTKYCRDSPTIKEEPLQNAILAAINSVMSDKPALLDRIKNAVSLELLPAQGQTMSLADIEHGRGDETVFLTEIRTACAAMPGRVMEMTQRDSLRQLAQQAGERESFGPCPRCGKPVVKTGSVWQCSSNKSVRDDAGAWKLGEGCGYKIFAEKFGKKLTDSMVRRTLEGKRPKVSGLKSKAGKTFDARLVPDRQYGIGLSFDDLNRKRK